MILRHAVPVTVLLVGVAAPSGATAATPVPTTPVTVPARPPAPATLAVAQAALRPGLPVTRYLGDCGRDTAKVTAPTAAITGRLGVLARPRSTADALTPEARRALRDRGITIGTEEPVRLLRTTRGGGKAWIVPVDDVLALQQGLLPCLPKRGGKAPRVARLIPPFAVDVYPAPPVVAPRTRRGRELERLRPALRALPRALRAARPAQVYPRPLSALAGVGPVIPPSVLAGKPTPGAVVVATGDAAPGGGGAFADLVKGAAPVSVKDCVGDKGNLVSISGVVPDDVGAVYLSSTDGSAVRADVKDNGYSFTVPARTPDGAQRFLVWNEPDGTPHTQPAPSARPPAALCRAVKRGAVGVSQITPGPLGTGFGLAPVPLAATLPVLPARPVRPTRKP